MKRRKKRIRKSIYIILILIIIIVLILVFKKDKINIELIDNLNIEINSTITNLDLIKNNNNYKILSKEEKIDTSKLGKKDINILIKDKNNKEHNYPISINIVDTTIPSIEYKDYLTTTLGKKIDLLENVVVTDNSNEDIDVSIEGDYSFDKVGTYKLYYVAKDSSENVCKKEFTLEVEDSNMVGNNTDNIIEFTTSKGFKGITKNGVTYIDGVLVVNKTYSLPDNYGNGLTSTTTSAFYKMQAASKLENLNIYLSSGFRSYSTQDRIYNNYVARDGKEAADTYSARPGYSEHQSGLAFDVNQINDTFNDSAEAKWLANNCYKYGFILRYPKGKEDITGYKYESWHFRYVGEELATKLYNNGNWITLEEYFGITSSYEE